MSALAAQFTAPDRLGRLPRLLSRRTVFLPLLASAWIGAFPVPTNSTPVATELNKRVLVLYSDDRLLRANVVFDENLRHALGSDVDESIECYAEFLDEARFPMRHQERMRDFLVAKYGERPPDVIVAFAPPSLDFCLRFRAELFPEAPIVFAAIDIGTFVEAEHGAQVTGVRSSFDGPATLRLALSLHPDTQQVFIVADSTALDPARAPMGWSDFRESDFQTRFQHLTNQPIRQLLATLAQLPAKSLVIYMSTFSNGGANMVPPQALAERMSQASTAPIYAAHEAFVGRGVVGAVTTPTRLMARTTAEMVLEILARRDGTIPPVRTLTAIPIFDWRELHRWGVREKQLPRGSVVLFAPPSMWQQHGKWVITVVVVFLVQSGLILALVLQSVRRRRAEREALQRRQELAHTTRVATMGELTASLAHEINQPLAAILSNAQAAQRLLATNGANTDEIRDILGDIVEDDQRAGEVIRRMRALLRKGESEPTMLDVNELVSEVAGLVHGEMILQNVTLAIYPWPSALWVQGDRIQLQQVLLNLIMNGLDAMKDTTAGERKLGIRTMPHASSVRVSVIDTGVGVPTDSIERIFDRFVTTKPHGMGLGLAICTSIIEAHGGRVGGTNNPGRGATFWFDVPMVEKVKR